MLVALRCVKGLVMEVEELGASKIFDVSWIDRLILACCLATQKVCLLPYLFQYQTYIFPTRNTEALLNSLDLHN